ncbi:MAG: VOC family protein, partial [Chloroflexia bacterium]|nr:VOC family protein [Chloroflexia bacterium]
GLSWQVVPKALIRLMSDPDAEKSGRVMQAMMQMGKIEVEGLERAYAGEAA